MPLSPHAAAAIAITIGALILLSSDKVALEHSCIAVLVLLVAVFELFPVTEGDPSLRGIDFLRGFGNDALITICLLLVLVKSVEASGALRPVGWLLVRLWRWNRTLALLITLVITAMLSAFFNNTPIVVILMPLLIGLAHRVRMAPSRILMPFCFATTMGGMTTTIGSSTNLLVVDVAERLGVERIGMFDFVVPAGLAAAAGIFYLWAIAPRLLPDRPSPLMGTAPRVFSATIEIDDGGHFQGRTLGEVLRLIAGSVRIERLQRGGIDLVRLPSLTLQPGDKLLVRGTPEAIGQMQEAAGTRFEAEDLRRGIDQRLVEIVVTRTSPLYGKRLSEVPRTALRNLFPVGVQRAATESQPETDSVLHVGDVILMQGHAHDIHELRESHDLLVLDRTIHVPHTANAPFATATLAIVIAVAAFGILPISASALCGAALLLLTRRMHWNEAWGAIDARLVIAIVTSLALGTALAGTGATTYIAALFVAAVQGLPLAVVLSGFLLLVALLNELVSNNALAIIGTPIAVAVAEQLGAPVLPFVLAVLFGANAGYITPIGYQTNLLVYTAGGYKFRDFVRVGVPLQMINWIVLSVSLSVIYL
jgi:di/tricarboxylate transporter